MESLNSLKGIISSKNIEDLSSKKEKFEEEINTMKDRYISFFQQKPNDQPEYINLKFVDNQMTNEGILSSEFEVTFSNELPNNLMKDFIQLVAPLITVFGR
ncbi:hypothetical protein ACFOW1_09800 [Parasediminibacterium paludis]|uniref:Uncharacterized protein n=1 Tax=Parasediminibacterium paludis TaxID=908966 RepID=A0ABV8PY12_9BACT